MKLLIAEDEKIEREALKQIFASEPLGIQIVGEATNGLQAVELNSTLQPDAILMDIRMGIMDGLKATEHIKKDNKEVEVIILTAFGLFEYSQQALRCSVFDYLLKPVEINDLLNTFQRLKEHIRLKKEKNDNNPSSNLFNLWANEKDHKNKNVAFNDERIEEAIGYIMVNLDKQVTLESIADLVHTSPGYLSRLFKSTTGVSLSSFIIEARIEKAKFLLLHENDKGLKAIAKEVGFSTVQHFCNTFKRIEKVSPANFRSARGAV
ncbi:MAG: hypothetical protein APF76_11590 [Desulfitibacter sp. BRH_c19]|nr:MAG: hypothetical protein APF76_11590 [Desulfitibacter sp. BRH_c19]